MMKLAGHVTHVEGLRNAYKFIIMKLKEIVWEGVDWISLVREAIMSLPIQ
jgi:hypothetical protein